MPSHRAIIHVDIQNDFCPGGSLAVTDGDKIVEPVNSITRNAQTRGDLIIFSADWHPPITKHFKKYGGIWPEHCVEDTPGANFHPDLFVPNGSIIVRKGTGYQDDGFSAFDLENIEIYILLNEKLVALVYTSLHELLDHLGIKLICLTGLATDYCVKASAIAARKLGYQVIVLGGVCRAVNLNPEDDQMAIEEMRRKGVIVT